MLYLVRRYPLILSSLFVILCLILLLLQRSNACNQLQTLREGETDIQLRVSCVALPGMNAEVDWQTSNVQSISLNTVEQASSGSETTSVIGQYSLNWQVIVSPENVLNFTQVASPIVDEWVIIGAFLALALLVAQPRRAGAGWRVWSTGVIGMLVFAYTQFILWQHLPDWSAYHQFFIVISGLTVIIWLVSIVVPDWLSQQVARTPLTIVALLVAAVYGVLGFFVRTQIAVLVADENLLQYLNNAWFVWSILGLALGASGLTLYARLRYRHLQASDDPIKPRRWLILAMVLGITWLIPISSTLPIIVPLRFILGIVAFWVPGLLIYWIIQKEPQRLTRWILLGMALSMALALLWLLFATVLGAGIQFVMWGIGLTTYTLIGFLMWRTPKIQTLHQEFNLWQTALTGMIGTFVILSSLLISHSVFDAELISGDYASYTMEVTNFGSGDPILQTAGLFNLDNPVSPRFRLSYWPGVQAVIAELGDIQTLLFYELFSTLVTILIYVALYELGRTMGLPPLIAGLGIVVHGVLIYYSWNEAVWGYHGILMDKRVLPRLFAPVLLISLVVWLRTPVWRNLLAYLALVLLIGYTHPTLLLFTCIVAGAFILFYNFPRRIPWQVTFLSLFVLGLMVVQYTPLRFLDNRNPTPSEYSGFRSASVQELIQIDELATYGSDNFFGMHPSTVLEITQFIHVIALVLLFLRAPKGHKRLRVLLLSVIFLYFLLIFPFSAVILARLATFVHLKRAFQITYPGIAFGVILWILLVYIRARFNYRALNLVTAGLLLGLIFVPLWRGSVANDMAKSAAMISDSPRALGGLMELEEALVSLNEDDIVVVTQNKEIMKALPALDTDFAPLIFRGETSSSRQGQITVEEYRDRIAAYDLITDPNTNPELWRQTWEAYNLDYFVIDAGGELDDYVRSQHGDWFEEKARIRDWVIFGQITP